MPDSHTHWENIYHTKDPDSVSWFQPSLHHSLDLIIKSGLAPDCSILDAGGGASTLPDDLLNLGYSDITVVDISEEALRASRNRLGPRAVSIRWIAQDITRMNPAGLKADLWHDRAVFHFMTSEQDRCSYCDVLERVVRPGGFVIMATFGPGGPQKCSGLDIVRYSPQSLHQTLGNHFTLIEHQLEIHTTPSGAAQEFTYCLFKKER